LINDPEKLEGIRARELDITKERMDKILSTGLNVALCSGGVDDLKEERIRGPDDGGEVLTGAPEHRLIYGPDDEYGPDEAGA